MYPAKTNQQQIMGTIDSPIEISIAWWNPFVKKKQQGAPDPPWGSQGALENREQGILNFLPKEPPLKLTQR
jgi:hypothetical protein